MTTLSGRGAPRARPTMRDVAALAGVSLKTVSRVINRESGVSDVLTAKVERAARELDFRPNLGARSLRRTDRQTATIGLILENVANPYSSALHRAVEDVARERGVAVLTGSLDEDPVRERALVMAFTSRQVDGLIVVPTGHDHAYLGAERQAGLPLVFVDRPPVGLAADAVLTDNRHGAETGVRQLVAAGHRRIAFLGDLATLFTSRERHAGYLDALGGEAGPDRYAVWDLHSIEQAAAGTRALFEAPDPPTALFTAQNLITIGARRALRDLRLHHRVAHVGFDDFPLADLLDPGITVVAQEPETIGRRAAEWLFRRLDGDGAPYVVEVVPTRLIRRGSGEIPPP